jgi:DNA repair protein RadC
MTYEIISVRKRKTIRIVEPVDIYKAIKRYANKKQEYFLLITLNASKEIIAIHLVTIGLANKTIIHAREIFKHVFLDNAVGIIIAHNHPSGAVQPSDEDIELTKHIGECCKILGIHFIDSLIIAQKTFYSFMLDKKMP